MFIDEAKIYIKAGKGGNGCMSFRRESFVPLGGPNGGDGGNGGDIVFRATKRLNTLLKFKFNQHYKSKPGVNGMGSDMHGKNADDLIVFVPVGTIIKNLETEEVLADLCSEDMECLAATGGRGGRGNARFKTNANKAPRRADLGTEGEEFTIFLELKLLADIGIVGYPNAGKSTLISRISAAKPKIADYPFTTLVPNLGVVKTQNFETFVVADIPGIIEGAHSGRGLGMKFLRHVERTKILVHVIDMVSFEYEDPVESYKKFNIELERFSKEIFNKPQIVVANKTEMPEGLEKFNVCKEFFSKKGISFIAISAVSGKGLDNLINLTFKKLKEVGEHTLGEN